MQIKCLIQNLADSNTQDDGGEGGGAGNYLKAQEGSRWQRQCKKAA